MRLESIPPITGAAKGFITSAPVCVLHMIGIRLATTVDTVMTLGRKRRKAPSFTAAIRSSWLKSKPRWRRFFFRDYSRYVTITMPV